MYGFQTRRVIFPAIAAGTALLSSHLPDRAPAMSFDFETPVMATPNAELCGETFAAQGVRFRAIRLTGTGAIGGMITLTGHNIDLRLYRDASANWGEQFVGPSLGGKANDLLVSFEQPLVSIPLTSDDTVETAKPIRLIALAATATAGRYRAEDFVQA